MPVYVVRQSPSGPLLPISVPDGPGGSCSPQPGIIWVNAATTTLPAEQNGTECTPFATIQQAANYLAANPGQPSQAWVINVIGNTYPESGLLTLALVGRHVTLKLGGSQLACQVSVDATAGGALRIEDGAILESGANALTLSGEGSAELDLHNVSIPSGGITSSLFPTIRIAATPASLNFNACIIGGLVNAPDAGVSARNVRLIGGITSASFASVDCSCSNFVGSFSGFVRSLRTFFDGTCSLTKTGGAAFWLVDGITQQSFANVNGTLTNFAYGVQDQPSSEFEDHGNFGAAPIIDLNRTPNHKGVLTQATAITLAPPPPGTPVEIWIDDDGGGWSFTVTASVGSIRWLGGSPPTAAGAGSNNVIRGRWDGNEYRIAWLPY